MATKGGNDERRRFGEPAPLGLCSDQIAIRPLFVSDQTTPGSRVDRDRTGGG